MSEVLSRRQTTLGELATVAKPFDSARRLELIQLLVTGEHTVEALARSSGMRVSTTSAHLQVLKAAGLVPTRREGTRDYYRLAADDVGHLYAAIRDLARDRSSVIYQLLHADRVGRDPADVLVSRADLLDLLDRGEVTLSDVRPTKEFEEGRISGAYSASLETSSRTTPSGRCWTTCTPMPRRTR